MAGAAIGIGRTQDSPLIFIRRTTLLRVPCPIMEHRAILPGLWFSSPGVIAFHPQPRNLREFCPSDDRLRLQSPGRRDSIVLHFACKSGGEMEPNSDQADDLLHVCGSRNPAPHRIQSAKKPPFWGIQEVGEGKLDAGESLGWRMAAPAGNDCGRRGINIW